MKLHQVVFVAFLGFVAGLVLGEWNVAQRIAQTEKFDQDWCNTMRGGK